MQITPTLIKGQHFFGSALLTTAHTTAEYVEQRRSWAERIFETPWHPFKATKTVTKYTTVHKPSREIYRVGDNFYAHPELIKEMVAAIDKVNNCPHSEWSEEGPENGWRAQCLACGTKAAGSCQS